MLIIQMSGVIGGVNFPIWKQLAAAEKPDENSTSQSSNNGKNLHNMWKPEATSSLHMWHFTFVRYCSVYFHSFLWAGMKSELSKDGFSLFSPPTAGFLKHQVMRFPSRKKNPSHPLHCVVIWMEKQQNQRVLGDSILFLFQAYDILLLYMSPNLISCTVWLRLQVSEPEGWSVSR